MKKQYFALLIAFMVTIVGYAEAGSTSNTGHIKNIVSRSDGLMIELDNGLPTLCTGTVGDWMIIPEANKSMIAVALMNMESQKLIEVYTDGTFLNGICKVTMFYVQGGN